MAFFLVLILFSQVQDVRKYLEKRKEYIESQNFKALKELSFSYYKKDKKIIYFFDFMFSLAALKEKKDFDYFCDSLFKMIPNPFYMYALLRRLNSHKLFDYSEIVIKKARKKFKNPNLFLKEYIYLLKAKEKWDEVIKEIIKIKRPSGFSPVIQDVITALDYKNLKKLESLSEKKEIDFFIAKEYLRRNRIEDALFVFKKIGKEKTVDSLVFLMIKEKEEDIQKIKKLFDKLRFDYCKRGYIMFKLKNYLMASEFFKKCKNGKFKEEKDISYMFYYLEKGDTVEFYKLFKKFRVKKYKSVIGEIYYKIGKYKMCDSVLKDFEDFNSLFFRAKSKIFIGDFKGADSVLSKIVFRYPLNDTSSEALFILYLIRLEEERIVPFIVKIREDSKRFNEYKDKLTEKWVEYFNFRKKLHKGEFKEIKIKDFSDVFLASLYYEGFKINIKKGKREIAKKFLKYIIDNFKETPYFIMAQRDYFYYFGGS